MAEAPTDQELQLIFDMIIRTKKMMSGLRTQLQISLPPTSASWLNQVEIWFGILSRKTLRGGASFQQHGDVDTSH